MNKQNDFQALIDLLIQNGQTNKIVGELLGHCLITEVTYTTFDEQSEETSKTHLLDIYEVRGQMETDRSDDRFVFGYDKLLPAF